MPRGKKPKVEPSVPWKVYIPLSVSKAVEHELIDPLTTEPVYGAKTGLVTILLREWLSTRKERKNP